MTTYKLTSFLFGRTALALGLAAAAAIASPLAAQMPGPMVLTAHPLKGGAYWVSGGVSNTGFVIGQSGVVVIDAQVNKMAGEKAVAEIAKITPKPIDKLVITHGDPDHVGGVGAYPGAEIIAHENTRAYVLAGAADNSAGPRSALYQDLAANHLPTHTLATSQTLTLDGVKMQLIHVAPAHTAGDLIVYLPAQKIVFGGDVILTNGRFPSIHIGGSSEGWIESMKAILALDADTFIPGHGQIETKKQLQARLKDVEERREAIKAMVYAGKSFAEIDKALPEVIETPMFPSFNQTTYDELTKGYPPAVAPWANFLKKP